MNVPPSVLKKLREARELAGGKRYAEAEQLYRMLLAAGGAEEVVFRELFQFYEQQKKTVQAISCLEEMARHFSDVPEWWLQLAQFAQSCGDHEKAILGYRKFLEQVPDRPNTVYNFAYLLKQTGRLEEALSWYQKALTIGVTGEEEVYTNIGVILSELRREAEARESYEKALKIRHSYVPAMLNLAALFEESGDRAPALALYEKALAVDSTCVLALRRMAYLTKVSHSGHPLVKNISSLLEWNGLPAADREELGFALGKLLDDCGEFDRAYDSYAKANDLGKSRFKPYHKEVQEKFVSSLIHSFPPESFEKVSGSPRAAPVFICGMFRSGSTLVEQMLGGHSEITSGGELEFFPRLVDKIGEEYPSNVSRFDRGFFKKVGADYMAFLSRRFDPGTLVTDKRPDNFLHIGLIKRALPNARFIWTRRGFLDNCLSVYFQQLGGDMNYSADLDSIGHYFIEQDRLMRHWQSVFPDSIFEVSYESLVENPESEVRGILGFLGLPWEGGCLDFHLRKNYVKTASVWQVRSGLHSGSIGRYKNYKMHISILDKYLQP